VPFALGGDNSPGNLRLLCGRHNRLEAERLYGESHMRRFRRKETDPAGHSARDGGRPAEGE
jgi:hypothetical protein